MVIAANFYNFSFNNRIYTDKSMPGTITGTVMNIG
jgi:hypothetical protein